MSAGVVYLLDRLGELVSGKTYRTVKERRDVIEFWRKMYAATYYSCIIQIVPIVDEAMVDENGLNLKIDYRKRKFRLTKESKLP